MPLTPEEQARLDALLARRTGTTPPSAGAGAAGGSRLSEVEQQRLATLRAKLKPVKPEPLGDAARAAQAARRPAATAAREALQAETTAMQDLSAEDALRAGIAYEVEQELPIPTSPEAKRAEVERRLAARKEATLPPLYMGGFGQPPALASYVPTAPPRNVPAAVPAGFMEALKPQTRIVESDAQRIERRQAQGLFDDLAFNAAIEKLTPEEQQDQRDVYEAYKAAYAKLQTLNPGESPEALLRDLDRQVQDLSSDRYKKFVDDPANRMGYTGDPLARALQRQVTTAEVPIFEPGQMEFLNTLDRIQRSRTAGKAESDVEAQLRTAGVEITQIEKRPTGDTGPGGKPVLEDVEVGTGQFRPATEAEIASAKAQARERSARLAGPVPFYMTPERDKILANIEASAKGGTFFQKEYPTGATVESPVSFGVRVLMAPLNAGIGLLSDLPTPAGEAVEARERAARPALYRDASAAVYNVAEGRGFMGEIGDLYEFSPDPTLQQYAWAGKAAGFAADLLSFDLGAARGAVTGAREAVALSRAQRAAGAASKESALARGFKAGSKEFLDTIGLTSAAKAVPLGDIRLGVGAVVGDSYRAADAYLLTYEDAQAAGRSIADAHAEGVTAAERAAPRAKAVDDMRRAGPAIEADLRSGRYFDDADEFAQYRRVSDAVDEAKSLQVGQPVIRAGAAEAAGRVGQVLRPYLSAATRSVPELRPALETLVRQAGPPQTKLRLIDVLGEVNKLPANAQEKFYDTVRQAAAFEAGFKTVDRATRSADPGRFVVRVTPNTFAPGADVDRILAAARATEEGVLVQDILNLAGRTGDEYALAAPQVAMLQSATLRLATTGTLGTLDAERLLTNLQRGVITGADMRTLMYSVTDAVAEQLRGGFRERFLAPAGEMVVPTRGRLPRPSPRAITFGENVGFVNSALQRTVDAVVGTFKATDRLGSLLTSSQKLAVADAKRAIGALPRLLEAELKTAVGAQLSDKVAHLLRAKITDVGSATAFWQNVAKSSVFSRTHGGVLDFLAGNFSFRDPYQMVNGAGRKKLYEVAQRYGVTLHGSTNPLDMQRLLPAYIDEVRDIVNTHLKKEVARSMHGVVDLKSRPQDVVLGAYFRGEADRIYAEALDKIVDFEPETIGQYNAAVRSALRNARDPHGRSLAGRPLAIAAAEQMLRGTSFSSPADLLRLPQIQRWIKDFDAAGVGSMPGAQLIRTFGAALLADVPPTVGALSARYASFPAEAIAYDMDRMLRGKAGLSEVASPLGTDLGRALKEVLGKELRFDEFNTELGILAEGAANGNLTMLGARKAMGNLIGAANSAFYNLLLYLNPRFHGGNVITGPAISYATTGSLGRLQNPIDRILGPVRDPFGIEYDMEAIVARAETAGVFKSQRAANLDPQWITLANKMGRDAGLLGRAGALLSRAADVPAALAEASDKVYRVGAMRSALQQGKTLDEAFEIGRRSLFDYGAVTDVERQYVARWILFYNFWRNGLVTTVDSMLRNPARFTRQVRLTEGATRMAAADDEQWSQMRFYTPYDAGVARIALSFAPQANREGKVVMLPNMPYYDAVYLISGLLSMPGYVVSGGTNPLTGAPEPGSSYVYEKLSPTVQTAIATVAGLGFASDVKLKAGYVPVEHAALLTGTGLMPAAAALFDLKVRPARADEEKQSFDGNVYTMKEEDFTKYKRLVKFSSFLGTSRPFKDYGDLVAMWGGFDGKFEDFTLGERVLQTTGFGTVSPVGTATGAEARAAEVQAELLKRKAAEQAEFTGLERPRTEE